MTLAREVRMDTRQHSFVKYSWFTTGYLILVICWGAVVRLTGSGAGCGDHWPHCNGQIVPLDPNVETLIEFGHRLTSGLSIILVIALVIFARRIFPPMHLVRKAAYGTLFFLIVEALLGAVLVLNHLVAENDSVFRAVMSAVHLTNTFFLLAFSAMTSFFAATKSEPLVDFSLKYTERKQFAFISVLLILVGMTGAIVALGDTLFPSESLIEGVKKDFDPTSHFLIRLRILHPILAIVTAALLLWYVKSQQKIRYYFGKQQAWHQLELLVYAQVLAGIGNFLLMAPAWLQILHLLLADLIWIRFVTAGASLFLVPRPHAKGPQANQGSLATASSNS